MRRAFRKRANRHLVCAAAAGAVFLTRRSFAQDDWQGGTGSWFSATNWTGGVPTSGTQAEIDKGGTAQIASGAAAASSEYVGYSTSGSLAQTGGVQSITGTTTAPMSSSVCGLDLATSIGSAGSYSLSAGTLSVVYGEIVGEFGTGTFTQSGGSNIITDNYLIVGHNSLGAAGTSSVGTYSLSAGSLETPTILLSDGNYINSEGSFNLSGTGMLTVSGAEQVGSRGFGATTAVFNQSGGTNSGGTLAIGNGRSTSSYTLSGGTLTVSGAMSLTGSNGSFSQTGGTATVGSVSNSATLTVSNSGQLSVAGTMAIYNSGRANLDVPSTTVGNLSISGNGIVNLNGGLTISYGSPATDPVSSIVSYLQNGYNDGAWTGSSGIISTSVAAGGPSPVLSIGYADGNTDTGTPAGPNQIVVQYTLAGDANLDGRVNSADLLAVIQNFNKTGTDWSQGNFTYGTSTNSADLLLIIQTFNQTLPPPAGSAVTIGGGSTLLATGATIPLAESARIQSTAVRVPEPAALACLAPWGLLLLRRRRSSPTFH